MMVEKADAGKPARIKVAAGVTTGELADWLELEANAVAVGHVGLPADVILNTVRYGGVIACACHGTYTKGRTVPDLVSGMTLVDCNGNIVSYDNDNKDWAKLKPVLSASLGMTGVVIDITLTLDDNLTHPYVDVQHSFRPMKDVFGEKGGLEGASRLKKLVEEAVATELFWFPMNSMSMVKLADFTSDEFLSDWDPWSDLMWLNMFDKRIEANPSLPVQKYAEENGHRRRELRETQFGTHLNCIGQKLPGRGTKMPLRFQALAGVLPMYVLPMEAKCGYLKSGTKTLMRAIHYQQCIDEFTCYDFEMCVPVKDDYSNVYAMWAAVVDILEETVRTEFTNPLNVAMEMRFTKGTSTTISPAHVPPGKEDQLFCWIEVLAGTGTPLRKSWIPFCKKVFDAWTSIEHPDGAQPKPHWAKWVDIGLANKLDPPKGSDPSMEDWLTPYVKKVYEEQLREFACTVQKLDPDGVFRCGWVSGLLPEEPNK